MCLYKKRGVARGIMKVIREKLVVVHISYKKLLDSSYGTLNRSTCLVKSLFTDVLSRNIKDTIICVTIEILVH